MLSHITGAWRKITGLDQQEQLESILSDTQPGVPETDVETYLTYLKRRSDKDREMINLLTRRIRVLESALDSTRELLSETVDGHNSVVDAVIRLQESESQRQGEFDAIAPTVVYREG